MSERGNCKRAVTVLLLAPLLAWYAGAATQDEEVLVDPTIPLEMLFPPAGELEEGEGGGFDFGTGLAAATGLFSGMLTSYELSSVLIRGDNRIAVINAQQVRVGDSVGNAKVTAIEADKVTLDVDGKIETLELYGDSIKTKTRVKGDE